MWSLNTNWHTYNELISNIFMQYDKLSLCREQHKAIGSSDLLPLLSKLNTQQDFHYTMFSIQTPPQVLQSHSASKKMYQWGCIKYKICLGLYFDYF